MFCSVRFRPGMLSRTDFASQPVACRVCVCADSCKAVARARFSVVKTDSAPISCPCDMGITKTGVCRQYSLVSFTIKVAEALPARLF